MVIGTILIGAVGAVVGVVIAPYRLNRIYVWLDPFRDPQGLGYQMVQSKVAIGSGGFGGLGPGQGLGKYFYLPEAHTDFAFPYSVRNTVFWARSSSLSFFSCLDM